MTLKEAFALIAEFVKLRYKRKFYGTATIIWVEGKIKTVKMEETYMSINK